jgi:hypothetical protein
MTYNDGGKRVSEYKGGLEDPKNPELMYRYMDTWLYYAENRAPRVTIQLYLYQVIKRTPCGVWIEHPDKPQGKFILLNTRKAFAYPTKEEAWNSFSIRKARQLRHKNRELSMVQEVNRLIKEQKNPPNRVGSTNSETFFSLYPKF